MKFVLGIFKNGAQEARHFAASLLSQGHEISQVFFYREGVFTNPSEWEDLNVPLAFCEAACERRQIESKHLPTGTLTQFFEAIRQADRHVIFG